MWPGASHILFHELGFFLQKWGCAQETGSGCGSWCRHLAAHMCSVVMLAAATVRESIPVPEADRPFSEPQFPHLATLRLRPHRWGTGWTGRRRPPLLCTCSGRQAGRMGLARAGPAKLAVLGSTQLSWRRLEKGPAWLLGDRGGWDEAEPPSERQQFLIWGQGLCVHLLRTH